MGRFLEGLVEALASRLTPFIESMAEKALPRLAELLAVFASLGLLLGERLQKIPAYMAVLFVENSPQVHQAALEMASGLWQALQLDINIIISVIIISLILLAIFVLSPLAYKAISRPHLGLFISFNHTREPIAEDIQKLFEKDGARVFRVAFQETAQHQQVIMKATKAIQSCNSVICLPGLTESYVEHEVLAATTSNKPMVFVISEDQGTLPNTADKRYPVFRLEAAAKAQFRPLIEFLNYIGADLKSTFDICRRALRHPYMETSQTIILLVAAIGFVSLLTYYLYRVITTGQILAMENPAWSIVQGPVVASHCIVIMVLASIALLISLYCFLVFRNLLGQFTARQRARLKTIAAEFNRDDWIGIIPGLIPGTYIYDCLFATAPSAHHEIERAKKSSSGF